MCVGVGWGQVGWGGEGSSLGNKLNIFDVVAVMGRDSLKWGGKVPRR